MENSNAYKVENAKPEHLMELVNLLNEGFLFEEPLNKAIKLEKDECELYFKNSTLHCLKSDSSILIRRVDNGQIVACALNQLGTVMNGQLNAEDEDGVDYERKINKMNNFVNFMRQGLLEVIPNGSSYLEICTLSVHPQYYRRGLGRLATEASIRRAEQLKCKFIVAVATNYKSQALFEKLQFQTGKTIRLTSYLDPDTNEPMFICNDGTTCAKLHYKSV
ncbi:hypothetical protein T07_5453 [Trichinella nelsoni]|uniref:aralkylamine N-acetyltransferase n=1 Tax=Trichinella nelsoni TaxID=6336 RepID=A0A0V0S8X2_9BILA|nr:hypothetical protein T07_5453 [Trichinella nelsoni]